ncbi:MAG: VacJ family lipoprotein [Methylovulum sp.]|nr:VacJ family lipoprotein [Methylovulum sp.]
MNTLRNIMRPNKRQRAFFLMLAGLFILNSGCATTNTGTQPTLSKADPYERINRKTFVFNDSVDDYVAAPIASAYKAITPQFVQTSVFNFYNNLKNINVIINDVLQAKLKQSAKDTGRFAINSSLGLLGLVDVAKDAGLEQNEEDFDQTLAVWGIPRGPYLIIPLLGPTTVRGIPGAIFDTAANPSSYVGAPVQLLSLLNARANAEGALKFIDEAALDPYVFTRESFLQWRGGLATDGKSAANTDLYDELDEFDAESAGSTTTPSQPIKNDSSSNQTFEEAGQSFLGVTKSFDETAKTLEDAGNKADKLHLKSRKKQPFYRR